MMVLDFVNASQPQIRWLDGQLHFLKYKTRVKGQIKDTVNEERERRLRLKERKYPRVGMIPNARSNIRTIALITACQIRTAARVGTNSEVDRTKV